MYEWLNEQRFMNGVLEKLEEQVSAYVTSKHVEEKIERSSSPGRLREDPRTPRNFFIQRMYSEKPRDVLEEDNEFQQVLRIQRHRASHPRNDNQNRNLKKYNQDYIRNHE